jgi:beta-lactamase regulating signal transducer with metallopeptidase domain
MNAGMLIYGFLIVALLAAAAWAVETLCRQFGQPARWVWLTSAVAAAALVGRAALVGDLSPTTLLATTASAERSVAITPAWTLLAATRDLISVAGAMLGSIVVNIAQMVPHWFVSAAAMAWLAASLSALVVLVTVHRRIWRARRDWPETELHGSRVRIAPAVGPAVVGVVRPEIVIPRWLLDCTVEEQRLALAHETEHLRARDHLLLGAGCVVVALVPWHPAVWWMLARLRLAIELDCDARVLRRGVRAREYGTLLIDLAGRCSGFRVGATALADERSHLERRLLAMNANRIRRPLLRAGALGTAAALALLAACEAKMPTAAEVDAMDVASAQRAATGVRMLQKSQMDSATFFVDGRQVDARTANALTPDQIATINVSKNDGAGGSTIRIVTAAQAARPDSGFSFSGSQATMQEGRVTMRERVNVSGASKFSGLIFIDGLRADGSALQSLDPKTIESIDVIKGVAAAKLSSDPAAKNGIIKVTTKK